MRSVYSLWYLISGRIRIRIVISLGFLLADELSLKTTFLRKFLIRNLSFICLTAHCWGLLLFSVPKFWFFISSINVTSPDLCVKYCFAISHIIYAKLPAVNSQSTTCTALLMLSQERCPSRCVISIWLSSVLLILITRPNVWLLSCEATILSFFSNFLSIRNLVGTLRSVNFCSSVTFPP